ncbi:MAG: PPC domain-containing protein [Verrucomicrobia bacterium]|nr:PPC domain-containing protein [Verrucomicrobiota bacterium]
MSTASRLVGACLQAIPNSAHRLQAGSYLLLAVATFAQPGQRPAPHLAFAYPAGGQQGTTFTVSIGGQNLNATAAAHFSHLGLTANILGYERPLTQKEINDLREEQQQLQDKRIAARGDKAKAPFTAKDEARSAEIRALLAKRGNRQISPVLAETVTLEVTIAADAAPGEHEVRLRTPNGLSNPMVFCVGQLREVGEPVQIATSAPRDPRANRETDPRSNRPKTELAVTIPTVVNGQILPGEVDHFRFAARKGQRVVLVAHARSLIPYLADAVPGWFQATLALFDAQGRELAYSDDYRFNPDPVLCYDIPADGDYVVEIKDAIFRGREDFVYRLSIGELPFVTGINPLGAACGGRETFELTGWNLPSDKLALDTKDRRPGTFFVSVRGQTQLSNPVRIALDGHTNTRETEPNNRPDTAQALTLPITVNGRIDRAGDSDVFRFEGKAGAEIVAEVFARRLGSPLDSVLKLTDAAGKTIASNDDYEDKAFGLLTHHADSRLTCKLPADGTYFITVADTQHQGGADYAYRLRVSPPQPDFELRVTPSSVNVRSGASTPLTVFALRHDGFAGEILLGLRNVPRGFALSGARIPPGEDKVQITLTAPFNVSDEVVGLSLAGTGMIDGKPVTHVAVPAEDMMQAFAYKHLVPARDFMADVTGRGAAFRVVTRGVVRLAPGGTTRIQISAPTSRANGAVHFELIDPPAGITIAKSTAGSGDTVNVFIACDPAKVKAGTQGNLLLNGFAERAGPNAAKAKAAPRQSLGAVPAIPFEVAGAPASSAQ